jgi:hypothetical protein
VLSEVLKLESDPSRSEHRILGAEICSQFIDDILGAAGLQLSLDDSVRIGIGRVAEKAQMLCAPYSQQQIAAGGDLELKLLVVLEPGLELLLACRGSQ